MWAASSLSRLLILACIGALTLTLLGACGGSPRTKTAADAAANTTAAEESLLADEGASDQPADKAEPAEEAEPVAPTVAKVGDAITLTGQDDAERVKVTVVEVLDPMPTGEFDSPASGKRYVGIVLRLTNVGSSSYSDSPSNGAVVVYGDDRQAQGTIVLEGPCSDGFSSTLKLAPGESGKGCLPFEVGATSTLKRFKFTLASGFADETGLWSLRD
ncbi:unannotated protein [freshwater metagenome]|uniref:Unannotated protein n=1 Tax=freshwater metagenome TaxID=449393 RepID=A0A6J7JAT4_9ZZZZ|nr:DUF4352 domain-containing protein [Actinomycetota bacterium]